MDYIDKNKPKLSLVVDNTKKSLAPQRLLGHIDKLSTSLERGNMDFDDYEMCLFKESQNKDINISNFANLTLARLYYNMNLYELSREALETISLPFEEIQKEGLIIKENVSQIIHSKGLTEYIKTAEASIRMFPYYWGAYYNLGSVFYNFESIDNAYTAYLKSDELSPDTGFIQFRLGEVSYERSALEPENNLFFLKQAQNFYSNAFHLNHNRKLTRERLKDVKDSIIILHGDSDKY